MNQTACWLPSKQGVFARYDRRCTNNLVESPLASYELIVQDEASDPSWQIAVNVTGGFGFLGSYVLIVDSGAVGISLSVFM